MSFKKRHLWNLQNFKAIKNVRGVRDDWMFFYIVSIYKWIIQFTAIPKMFKIIYKKNQISSLHVDILNKTSTACDPIKSQRLSWQCQTVTGTICCSTCLSSVPSHNAESELSASQFLSLSFPISFDLLNFPLQLHGLLGFILFDLWCSVTDPVLRMHSPLERYKAWAEFPFIHPIETRPGQTKDTSSNRSRTLAAENTEHSLLFKRFQRASSTLIYLRVKGTA